jgi:DNA-binding MarR family transcriptional regulator
MSTQYTGDAYQVIWLIRRLFRALAQASGRILEDFGISVAERAVLEFLYPDEALTVPEIARRYQVSRQHVQVTVNALLEAGLVAAAANPRHKRSPLIHLNGTGRARFCDIRQHEEIVVNELFAGVPAADVRLTRQTLAALYHRLSEGGTP